MKQRFSSLDVRVIAHELSEALVTLRLANIYDLNSKTLLLKFAKPEVRQQLLVESGFRCHLTDFARTSNPVPGHFVTRLRKFLRTRRVTHIAQIGSDRIIEFQFSDGAYRLYLEFFASGNIILTDSDLKILALLRNVSEGGGQEAQRVGLSYQLENRQNFGGVPPLTKERVRDALETTVKKSGEAEAPGKKKKKKANDELRRGLSSAMNEMPPALLEHVFRLTEFDPTTKPADILGNDSLFDALFQSLDRAREIVEEITTSAPCTGYIVAKAKPGFATGSNTDQAIQTDTRTHLLYEDFQPFLPKQFEEDASSRILTYHGFNKTVDEFFSSVEGRKLESKVNEREAAAKRKLESARRDQEQRIEGLQGTQELNLRKAAAIEANVERVQEAMDAVKGLLDQGMDWVDANKMVEREQGRGNPVAQIIKLPMRLAENIITLEIGESVDDEDWVDIEDPNFDYDSEEDTGDEDEAAAKAKVDEKRVEVDIKLDLTPWANAGEYYDQKRQAADKATKTIQQSTLALRNAEHKIAKDLKAGLKQEKPVLQPIRKPLWFEKFLWFLSSDGYLVLGGRDSAQNEILYKRHLRKGDVYVHADLHGAASVVIKNKVKTADAPIPPSTLAQASALTVCSSGAWDSKAGMPAWWVKADQVSKSAPTGEYLPAGSFTIRGTKNFMPPAQLILGFGLMFKVSEESMARHVKHRLHDGEHEIAAGTADDTTSAERDAGEVVAGSDKSMTQPQQAAEADASESEHGEDGDAADSERANPLQTDNESLRDASVADVSEAEADVPTAEDVEEGPPDPTPSQTSQSGTPSAASSKNKTQPKRGQRGKAKKIAAKYKDQDEEDRALMETLIGVKAGREKAQAEAAAKAQREAEAQAAQERRRQQLERQKRAIAEHEEVRRVMLEADAETPLDEAEAAESTPLDALVGTPLAGDEVLEVIPFCAPWAALARVKYKAKLQPGAQKKGKAVKEIMERWRHAAARKGVVDEAAADPAKMWPREVELIRGLKPEEAINCVPVGKVTLMMAGGLAGGGGASGRGGKVGKGSKKK